MIRSVKLPHRFTLLGSLLAAGLVLSGCNASSGFSSASLTAALTPQESDLEQAKAEDEAAQPQSEADATSQTAETEEQKPDQPTELALAAEKPSSIPEQAANSLAKPAGAPAANSVASGSIGLPNRYRATSSTATQSQNQGQKQASPSPNAFFANLFQQPNTSLANRSANAATGGREATQSRNRPSKPAPRVRVTARNKLEDSSATRRRGSIFGLPGVKRKNLFSIEDEIEREEFDEPIRTASIANLATRGAHGLLLQRPDVQVGCFPRSLLAILTRVERRFKRKPLITSGYRSPRRNRLVRGARRSTHMRCMAADIQVKGVSKWQLAKYLRSLPGRGGVGTYCHTNSVHIDVGSKRAWHHCRRSRKKRRRNS
ncbi:MAG: D-Ala-D-Ala carboxypeptidase family metallohydrolase [Ahrensia sp.]|nr:D-Ala-D-Ala carboxypeptidase family metallohydrolase [Ahrensia sp.]